MKTRLIIFYLMFLWTGGSYFVNSFSAQVMSFSADTISREACDSDFYLVGHINLYNLTDEAIPLKWEQTQNLIPVDGNPFLIVNGTQYLPHTQSGMTGVDQHDSIEVYFNFFINEDMSPGDSAIYQIRIYAPEDSANTQQLLTAILFCPLSTALEETDGPVSFLVYPNPFHATTTIQLTMEMDDAHLEIYSVAGKKMETIPVDGVQISMERNTMPPGMYMVCLVQDGLLKGTTRIMIID